MLNVLPRAFEHALKNEKLDLEADRFSNFPARSMLLSCLFLCLILTECFLCRL